VDAMMVLPKIVVAAYWNDSRYKPDKKIKGCDNCSLSSDSEEVYIGT
jgi:hypothetical protein